MNEFLVKDKASLYPMLRGLYHHTMMDVFKYMIKEFPTVQWVITSTYRAKSKGVHGTLACRGLDLRSRHLPLSVQRTIEKTINDAWEYDFERPGKQVCMLHGEAVHFHIQVHNHTERRVR